MCDACIAMIQPVVTINIPITKTCSVKVYAISRYQEPLCSLIRAKHVRDIVASTELGELLWQMTHISSLSFDYLIPIPLHWTRYAWRGFNQADEIARVISRHSGKPVVHILKRVRKNYLSGIS